MKHARGRRLESISLLTRESVYIYIYDCQVLKGERALKLRGMSNDGAVAATVQIRWGWSLISSRIHVDCTDGRALAKIRAPLLILISGGIGTRININSSINSNILERIPPPDPFDHYDHFRFTIVSLQKFSIRSFSSRYRDNGSISLLGENHLS